jgi:hypothetical protein
MVSRLFSSAIALRIAFFCFHCPVILGGVLIAGVVGDALCRGFIMENVGQLRFVPRGIGFLDELTEDNDAFLPENSRFRLLLF